MNYSRKTTDFLTSLIHGYSRYDKLSESFELHIDDIDSDDLYKLCGFIMQDCPESAFEATSIDNPLYEKIMLPALIEFMKDSSLPDMCCFSEKWQKGILSYLRNRIISLLDDALEIYNQDMAA